MTILLRNSTAPDVSKLLRLDPENLAHLASQALKEEASLSPKPALVDSRGSGAHTDMDVGLLMKSAHCLEPYFCKMAAAAIVHPIGFELRRNIGAIGRDAERAMRQATNGVNTHKGAIWALGLLVAAATNASTLDELFNDAGRLANLPDEGLKAVYLSNGLQVRHQYGLSGAKEEAQQGFPHIQELGLPMLFISRARGDSESDAQLNALLAIMTRLSDTCVASRAGLEGVKTMQKGANAVLDAGGTGTLLGRQLLNKLEQDLLRLNASPGGAADLLAATLFIDSLTHQTSH
ncbi:triphosphoribosyl-dephospho-CoA synthase MdcB [Marinomonas sp. A3A]|uniref:triphosphoribosyl-dephospho-CoA synthase n=1 Tax=Marinomonas sp. A3A TaxID=2065312 RepID=UPI001BB39917|nr:triphosphoribosyl-dephospho-CoA synthase [Marinomonas sp. A3A]QUX90188.1 triphosphoribosyl-dephospho-CoA synthase MdcB [Marinomonas sp. A3A]